MLLHSLELRVTVTSRYLIVPGLNQSPELYRSIIERFPNGDIALFPSNVPNVKEFHQIEISKYVQILKDSLDMSKYEIVFAHSLGALIAALYLQQSNSLETSFKLISPAFKGRWGTRFMGLLPGELPVLSFNRPRWRVHRFCLVSHYQQILKLQNDLNYNSLSNMVNVELVFDPRDEIINVDILQGQKNRREHLSKNFPRHLCLDYIEKELFRLFS